MTLMLALALFAAGDNELPEQEKKDGWVLLFDGKTPEGWVNLKSSNIEDGTINPFKSGNYVNYATEKYADVILACDFKVSKGCNSGIFIRTGNPKDPVQTGIEIQVLDSAGKEKLSKHTYGAL